MITNPVRYASSKARGLEDVAGVLRRKPPLDDDYLQTWLASFREVLNRDLVSEFKSIQDPCPALVSDRTPLPLVRHVDSPALAVKGTAIATLIARS